MAETKTLAWHGDPDLKAEVMARLRQHRAEDSIIDVDVARAIDNCFEELPADKAGDFAVAVVEAIPVGADLSDFDYDAFVGLCDRPDAVAGWLIGWLSNAPVPAVAP